MNHKFYHKGERNVGTVAQVSTISAYPSLSEGDLDKSWNKVSTIVEVYTISAYPLISEGDLNTSWNKCGHDRRSWHYLGLPFTIKKRIWTNICKVGVLRSGIGPISSNVGLIRSELGLKFNKVGTIESGFGTQFEKVDTIGHPN